MFIVKFIDLQLYTCLDDLEMERMIYVKSFDS